MGCIRWTREEAWEKAAGRALAALFATVAVFMAFAAGADRAGAQDAGAVNFVRNADSEFAVPYIGNASEAEKSWMREHYWRLRGYEPYHDRALSWGPPSHVYQDLYGVFPNLEEDVEMMKRHPDWILRDSHGHKLYIPFACSGGTCPAIAGDIGNPEFRAMWIERAREVLSRGYVGLFIDNVNMEMKVSDGYENLVKPIDPRTGRAMTDTDWRRYVAEFTEEIAAAFPEVEITHNVGQWWASREDPYVQRQVQAADIIELERGLSDSGLTGGTGTFGYETKLGYVDWVHSLGKSVTLEPQGIDTQGAELELASYFLVSEGGDSIASDFRADPDDWWNGWETNLGEPTGVRYTWKKGIIRRDFTGGVVLVNPPDSPWRKVRIRGARTMRTVPGSKAKRRVQLAPGQGTVLIR